MYLILCILCIMNIPYLLRQNNMKDGQQQFAPPPPPNPNLKPFPPSHSKLGEPKLNNKAYRLVLTIVELTN